MATKAELEKELAALKQELEQSRAAEVAGSSGSDTPGDQDGDDSDAHGLKKVLKDHGMDAESIESLSGTLFEELKALQKEKPLTVALAAFALGLVVGRASK